jgi:hypothetical protein
MSLFVTNLAHVFQVEFTSKVQNRIKSIYIYVARRRPGQSFRAKERLVDLHRRKVARRCRLSRLDNSS